MNKEFLLLVILIIFKITSFSQERVFFIQRLRVHIKNEVKYGQQWLTDAFNKEATGQAKFDEEEKEVTITIAGKIIHSFYYNFSRAKFDESLNAYVIPFCDDKVANKKVALVLSSENLSSLKYVGVISFSDDCTLELAMYHFQRNPN